MFFGSIIYNEYKDVVCSPLSFRLFTTKADFLSQRVTFPPKRVFTKASASHDGWTDTKPMEKFPFSFACEVFAQKSGAIRATSSRPRVDFSSRYCGMKFGKILCETHLTSGSCFPLHFHPSRDSDFPVGRCQPSATPQESQWNDWKLFT